jgi:hypothetical protein
MPIDRRSFVAAAAGGVAAATMPARIRGATPDPHQDPLGVRSDFPVTTDRIYLNTAYIAPIHRAAADGRPRAH